MQSVTQHGMQPSSWPGWWGDQCTSNSLEFMVGDWLSSIADHCTHGQQTKPCPFKWRWLQLPALCAAVLPLQALPGHATGAPAAAAGPSAPLPVSGPFASALFHVIRPFATALFQMVWHAAVQALHSQRVASVGAQVTATHCSAAGQLL